MRSWFQVVIFLFSRRFSILRVCGIEFRKMKNTIRKYGSEPFALALLHGGPGAAGEMRPVAEALSGEYGVLEFLQTEDSVEKQVGELREQMLSSADGPLVLIGYSWGAWLAVLFSAKYPDLVKKVILISAGSFDNEYNADFTKTRLERLSPQEKEEAQGILGSIDSKGMTPALFLRFGQLMEKSDSYSLLPELRGSPSSPDMDIFQRVWREARALRDSGELLKSVEKIGCPVVAIHGEYDPHPMEGVEKPLSGRVSVFKMIRLKKCGHIPWREKYARDDFYRTLGEEIAG